MTAVLGEMSQLTMPATSDASTRTPTGPLAITRTPRTERALDVLLRWTGAILWDGPSSATPHIHAAAPIVVVVPHPHVVTLPDDLVEAATRIVVAAAPGATIVWNGGSVSVAPLPIELPSRDNPLVASLEASAVVCKGRMCGSLMAARDFAAVSGGTPILTMGPHVVGVQSATVVVVGSSRIVDDASLIAADTIDVLAWLLTENLGNVRRELALTAIGPPVNVHAAPRTVSTQPSGFDLSLLPAREHVASQRFVRAAGRSGRLLPPDVHDALVDFADETDPSGALLIRGLPVGELPATPTRPTTPTPKDQVSEFVLLTAARRLGQPVGYLPEHGGDLVQNIVPMRGTEASQVSTSSKVELMFHTEAAFHPHRPRYLLLLCLRGDADGRARTTLASITEVVRTLPLGTRRVLFEARFRTAADESYVGCRPTQLGAPIPVLSGSWERPSLVFDADLMVGVDAEAQAAVHALTEAIATCHTGVVLEAGDLLVVDNAVVVHGRSPFVPRFDGTDRWLQRAFVVSDLAPSSGDRDGRIIATRFAA
jgi:L-asparagine oxygenase